MSKRLQVLLPDGEFRKLQQASKKQKKTVAQLVRESIATQLQSACQEASPEHRIARILKFAKYTGPTGSIADLLAQIEAGRNQ